MPVMNSLGVPDVGATKERCRNIVWLIGQEPVEESQLAQAFDDAVWFWEHSLEYEPSFYGVRLSFFLSSFVKLASAYEPARKYIDAQVLALKQDLSQGQIDAEGYSELTSLQNYLERTDEMPAQLRQLAKNQPELALKVGPWEWELWVDLEQWDLFEKYPPMPDNLIEGWVCSVEGLKPLRASEDMSVERWTVFWQKRCNGRKVIFDKVHRAYQRVGLADLALELMRLEPTLMQTFEEGLSGQTQ